MQEDFPAHTLDRPSAWEPRPPHTPSDSPSLDSQEGTMSSQRRQKPVFTPGTDLLISLVYIPPLPWTRVGETWHWLSQVLWSQDL